MANDEKANGHGFLTLVLVGLVSTVLSRFVGLNYEMPGQGMRTLSLISTPIFTIIGFLLGYSIYHFLAKIFSGKATGGQYFRVMSNAMILSIASVIPFLGGIAGLYMLGINGFVLHKIHQLSVAKAIVVLLIPVVLLIVLGILAGMVMLAVIFA